MQVPLKIKYKIYIMEPDNNTYDTLDGGNADSDIASSSVKETASAVSPDAANTLSLAEINAALGKNFTNKDAALKSFKDTFSYVGKKLETTVDPNQYISRDQYETDLFYTKNPEYEQAGVRSIIDSMAKTEGKKPSEIVNMDSFKTIFSKVKGYDENQNSNSVLETSPHLTSSRDKQAKAKEALKEGNKALAEDLAVQAVMDTLNKK